tara:strand:+ start:165 stop:434 length:270 start_codon:yes stop_codon:yes gene_type:complete
MTIIVISICVILLLAVVVISAKPIGMGIEARRNYKDDLNIDNIDNDNEIDKENDQKKNISDEIIKLNELRNSGLLSNEEFEKAKKKLFS